MAESNGAQPDAQADAQPEEFPPDTHMVGAFHAEMRDGPGGQGRFLAVHCFQRGEILLLNLTDDKQAEKLAQEIKPSHVEVPGVANGLKRSPGGLVTP